MRTDLTLVVSPLVSLMQDQVEALERVAPGRVALVNAQRDAATNRRAVEQAVAGHVRLLYVAPERFSSPGFLERLRGARDRPVRGRRGALRLAVGARLPARLLPARRRRALARGRSRSSPRPRRRRRRSPADIVDAPRAARPGAGGDRLRPAEPVLRGRPVRDEGGRPPRDRGGAGRAGRAAGDRLRGHARGVRQALAARLARELGVEVAAYHAGLPREARAEAQRRFMAGEARGRGGDERVRHGRRQGRRADGLPRERARLGRGLLPGGRPRRARRQAGALPAVRLQPRQGPARLLHRALDGRRGARSRPVAKRLLGRGASTGASRSACRSCARSRAARRTTRCARSSATSPAPA